MKAESPLRRNDLSDGACEGGSSLRAVPIGQFIGLAEPVRTHRKCRKRHERSGPEQFQRSRARSGQRASRFVRRACDLLLFHDGDPQRIASHQFPCRPSRPMLLSRGDRFVTDGRCDKGRTGRPAQSISAPGRRCAEPALRARASRRPSGHQRPNSVFTPRGRVICGLPHGVWHRSVQNRLR